jgi:tight adherence protein C
MDISNLLSLGNLLIVGAIGCLVFGAATFLAPQGSSRRLRGEAPRASPAGAPAQRASLRRGGSAWERLITRPFKREQRPPGGEIERNPTQLWLIQAGYDSPLAPQTYYASRLGLGLVLPIFMVAATPILFGTTNKFAIIIAGCLGVLIGTVGPAWWVGRRLKIRQRQIVNGLPEILDLLLVCTEAGLGVDTAIDRVGEECANSQPVLAAEMKVVALQLRAGRQRADAMRAFADRTGVEEVRSLVNLLLQADAFGTSIAQTLRVYSEDLRTRRLLRAEEAANTVTVKLSMVLVACFLPALLVAIMAPIVTRAIAVFPKFG